MKRLFFAVLLLLSPTLRADLSVVEKKGGTGASPSAAIDCPFGALAPAPLDQPYHLSSVDELLAKLRRHDKADVLPIAEVPQPNPRNADPAPFGKFTFRAIDRDNRTSTFHADFADLPADVRRRGPGDNQFLFFGRPLPDPKRESGRTYTPEELDGLVVRGASTGTAQFFANGRRFGDHNANNTDISLHQGAKNRGAYNSRYQQSTPDMMVAHTFALEPPHHKGTIQYGIIYVLDPRPRNPADPTSGPQVVDLNRFHQWANNNRDKFPGLASVWNEHAGEAEVLWANIPPGDVVGAYIVKRDPKAPVNLPLNMGSASSRIVGFMPNPNYVRR